MATIKINFPLEFTLNVIDIEFDFFLTVKMKFCFESRSKIYKYSIQIMAYIFLIK